MFFPPNKLVNAILNDGGNYEQRKLGRVDVNGLTVSTCYTSDMGYETAILDDNGVYPVERYSSQAYAVLGHDKWCKEAETLTEVTMIGYDDLTDDELIKLQRR
jgi:hypothetical protein